MKGKADIREFVRNLLITNGDTEPLADQDSLLLSGRLQSIDAVEIVVFLEQNFGIDFAEIGFDQELVDSVDAICALSQTAGVPRSKPTGS
jgi:acyl carrier protein